MAQRSRSKKSGERTAGKPIAAFDLDGTFIREQLLVLLTKECFELEIFRHVAEVIFKEVRLSHRDRKITFEEYDRQIIDIFAERVKGKLRSDVQIAAKRVYEKNRDWLYKFTKALLDETVDTHDRITITGAMQETVSLLAPYWGFSHCYSTVLAVDELGRYTGESESLPVRDKRAALLAHAKKHGCSLKGSLAIGDTLSDVPMLQAVDIPVVFNPDDKLAEISDQHGWITVVERKDCIYVLHDGKFQRFSSDSARAAARHVLAIER
jgi:HAD superfamily hydrolase (TIGR01490 family)